MKQRALQFLKYINNVYRFNQFLTSLSDGRTNPSIPLNTVIAVIFLGLVTRMGSLNQMEERMRLGYFNKALRKGFVKGSADTLAYAAEFLEVEELIDYHHLIVQDARYNKVFQGGTLDGFKVISLDGTRLTTTESRQRHCDKCKRTELTAEDGTGYIQWHEDFVGASYVGRPPNLILGIERIEHGEGETTATLRLLDKIRSRHYYYAEVVTLDSLYTGAPVINKLLDHNVIGIIRVKQEHYNLIKDAKGLFSNHDPDIEKRRISIKSSWYEEDTSGSKYDYAVRIWDEENFTTWQKVKKPLRVLKVEETRIDRRGRPLNSPQITYMLVTAGKDVISTETVWRILHRRWDIENKTFHDLKKYWSFGHDFHHEDNAFLAIRWLIVIAVNLFLLFLYRRLSGYARQYTQKGLVKDIAFTLSAVRYSINDYG